MTRPAESLSTHPTTTQSGETGREFHYLFFLPYSLPHPLPFLFCERQKPDTTPREAGNGRSGAFKEDFGCCEQTDARRRVVLSCNSSLSLFRPLLNPVGFSAGAKAHQFLFEILQAPLNLLRRDDYLLSTLDDVSLSLDRLFYFIFLIKSPPRNAILSR